MSLTPQQVWLRQDMANAERGRRFGRLRGRLATYVIMSCHAFSNNCDLCVRLGQIIAPWMPQLFAAWKERRDRAA